MKKVIEYIKNHIWVIYLILFVFMVVRHASVKLEVADDVWFLEQSKMGNYHFRSVLIVSNFHVFFKYKKTLY